MLGKRVITGVIALLCVLGALFLLPPILVVLLIGAIVVVGAFEWGRFVAPDSTAAGPVFALCLIPLLLVGELIILRVPDVSNYVLFASQIIWVVALVFLMRFPMQFSKPVTWLFGTLLLLATFVALVRLYRLGPGPALLLALLVVVWAADIGAYFSGKRFGRHKLAPSVSPGKSWQGVVGGLLLVALVAFLAGPIVGIDRQSAVLIALPVAMLSVLGDLTVSMFKRNAGLKDSGTLFPGHGGVMDRIDSISAAAPLFVLLWQFSGR